MIPQPSTYDDLAAQLAACSKPGEKISRVDLSRLAALVEHTPEDMTATVQAGMTLDSFQAILRRAGQWLPIDPPQNPQPTIADLLAHNLSGPRRLGYGTIRDYLIGIKVALPEGQLIKAGGKVVKNVAGYDLCKLFIGARHSLGIIVEATFKLRPLPETECFAQAEFNSFQDLDACAKALLASAAEPALLDADNLSGNLRLVTAFAGMREDVDVQMNTATSLRFAPIQTLPRHAEFWSEPAPRRASVLPSKTAETIAAIHPGQFVARIGNGIIYFRGGTAPHPETPPARLIERVKQAYDPRGILPSYSP